MKTFSIALLLLQILGLSSTIEASQRFLARETAESLFGIRNGFCAQTLVTARRYLHTSPIPRGVYAQPTEDAIFKHLMSDKEVRNSFLQSMLGETVTSSEILDASLNPVKSYQALRACVNDRRFVQLMADIEKGKKQVDVRNKTTNQKLHQARDFLVQLAPLYYELVQALPDADRNTQLDLVCDTPNGIINVEVQVEPQNFWAAYCIMCVGYFIVNSPKGLRGHS